MERREDIVISSMLVSPKEGPPHSGGAFNSDGQVAVVDGIELARHATA